MTCLADASILGLLLTALAMAYSWREAERQSRSILVRAEINHGPSLRLSRSILVRAEIDENVGIVCRSVNRIRRTDRLTQ